MYQRFSLEQYQRCEVNSALSSSIYGIYVPKKVSESCYEVCIREMLQLIQANYLIHLWKILSQTIYEGWFRTISFCNIENESQSTSQYMSECLVIMLPVLFSKRFSNHSESDYYQILSNRFGPDSILRGSVLVQALIQENLSGSESMLRESVLVFTLVWERLFRFFFIMRELVLVATLICDSRLGSDVKRTVSASVPTLIVERRF